MVHANHGAPEMGVVRRPASSNRRMARTLGRVMLERCPPLTKRRTAHGETPVATDFYRRVPPRMKAAKWKYSAIPITSTIVAMKGVEDTAGSNPKR